MTGMKRTDMTLLDRCLAEMTGKRELTATEKMLATNDLAHVLMGNEEFQRAAMRVLYYQWERDARADLLSTLYAQ